MRLAYHIIPLLTDLTLAPKGDRVDALIELMKPVPSPVGLIRIGGDADGAYIIPNDLDGIRACFSPGVNNFKRFEDELANRYGIVSHMCDPTSDLDKFETPLIEGMQTFDKKWLAASSSRHSLALDGWIKSLYPSECDDLLLQIDIEGGEFEALADISQPMLSRFRIIVIEVHWLVRAIEDDEQWRASSNLLKKLISTHACVHVHPNNCCGQYVDAISGKNMPNVIELTLLRRDRFQTHANQLVLPTIPSDLDILRNVHFLPPIQLSSQWLENAVCNHCKRLEDQLDFELYKSSEVITNRAMASEIMHASLSRLYADASKSASLLRKIVCKCASIEVANGRSFVLSQAYPGFPGRGIVKESDTCFFHTSLARRQSITIDLGEEHLLQSMTIVNRKDCYFDRAIDLFWAVHNNPLFNSSDLMPILTSQDFQEGREMNSTTPLMFSKGRYVSIFSPAFTALHFSSIRIYGVAKSCILSGPPRKLASVLARIAQAL